MKLTIEPKSLADAVKWAGRGLPARPVQPVLAGLMLTVANGQLHISGFDYEVSCRASLDVPGASDGAALVSGRLLSEISAALPNREVQVAAAGAHLEMVCGSARFTLPTMPAEDYPALPDMPTTVASVAASEFATAVAQIAVAAGKDDTLPLLTGIMLDIQGDKVTMISTDRYRLAVREMTWKPTDPGYAAKVLVPARNLHDAAKNLGPLGGDVTIAVSDEAGNGAGMVGIAAGGRRTTTRLLDTANYPPVLSLFPAAFNARAYVDQAALATVVKRVALVAERTTPVLLTFTENGLVVEAGGTEEARASEAMDCRHTGPELTVGFNPQYLLDGLSQLSAPVAAFSFVDAFKPAVIEPAGLDDEVHPGYRYLIMPIRITR